LKQRFYAVFISNILLAFLAISQDTFNHPELEWRTIETKHFLVHFHNGEERTASEIAHIAESIYGPVTTMYNHEPDQRVSFFIRDHDDYSNGGSYFYENRIEIYAPAMDYEWRGIHPWLWNVITHEFTHMVQIQTAMKFGRKFPGFYFQWLGYEKEKRPDVLYGYPNIIVSYPFSGFVVPVWFAEGTAQYNNPSLGYDCWDSHRDMILRMYMIDGNPISWEEMGVFGKNGLGNESAYNAGFSLVGYIGQKYGTEKLQDISRKLAAPFRLTIDGAIELALGKTGEQLYQEWKTEKTAFYLHIKDSLSRRWNEGTVIESGGFGNYYPVFLPDSSKIAYISNKDEDYLSLSSVYIYDPANKTSKLIQKGVRSSISFSSDAQYMYYANTTSDNPNWCRYSDLFKYDCKNEKEERLTYGLRAFNPKLSSDGKKLAFAFGKDGTLNIGICNADGKKIIQLTDFKNGEQVYTPVWSNNGTKIAFGYSAGHNQSIALIDSDGKNFQILRLNGDSRNPFFASDSILYYSWDRGGIFNIYSHNLNTGLIQQVTHVLGGAFLPTLNTQGDLVYVSYTSSGYKIAEAYQNEKESASTYLDVVPFTSVKENKNSELAHTVQSALIVPRDSLVQNISFSQSKPYKYVFTSLSLIPFVRIDNYTESGSGFDMIKPGLYVSSSDVLEKMTIFGGAAINRKFERDLFLIIENSDRLPLLYEMGLGPKASLELYNITRKRDVSFDLYVDRPQTFFTDVTYNLFEFDFSLAINLLEKLPLKVTYALSRYSQDFGSWFHPRFGVIPASRSTYFIGNAFSAKIQYDGIRRTVDRDINPMGRKFSLKYYYEIDEFNPTDSAKYDNGFRIPIYSPYNFHRLELNWAEHIQLPMHKHTLTLGLNAAGILGPTIDDFFDYYAGGFIGMRGYPFYAIGGNKFVSFSAEYRVPLSTELNFRILQLYFKKLFGSVFCDVGDAWSGTATSINNWKRDVGFELRLETYSFYTYPTRIFFSGAYGLDRFSRNVRDINTTTVFYGREWRFYLGVLFGFELNDILPRQFMR
jgi:Tol biopolymer transport system component